MPKAPRVGINFPAGPKSSKVSENPTRPTLPGSTTCFRTSLRGAEGAAPSSLDAHAGFCWNIPRHRVFPARCSAGKWTEEPPSRACSR